MEIESQTGTISGMFGIDIMQKKAHWKTSRGPRGKFHLHPMCFPAGHLI